MASAEKVVKVVKISELKGAEYNPEHRTEEGARGLAKLAQSIEKIGLMYPLLVSKNFTIIEGHRRLAACKSLGWTEVPVLFAEGDPDLIYAEVNSNNQKLDGAETLMVWLKRPTAVTEYTDRIFRAYEEKYGRQFLDLLAKMKMSVRPLQTGIQIAKYVDDESPNFVRKASKWVMKFRASQIVSAYIRMQQSPATLYKAVNDGKELKSTFRVR